MDLVNFQTVMQLVVGLNTIFFSFKEIRHHTLLSEREAISGIITDIERLVSTNGTGYRIKDLSGRALQCSIDLDTIWLRNTFIDEIVKNMCLMTSVFYTGVLIFSSFVPRFDISFGVGLIISIAGFLPILFCVTANMRAAAHVAGGLRGRRSALEAELARLSKR